ncbi:MAG TPA: zinc ribbon domain-containing protein [Pyrinomonadaceae bacterium]
MSKSIAHYCQRCLSANPLGQDFCVNCGTRLMLVVEPSSARFEAPPDSMLSTNEHLLERVSATETRITRLAERLERSLDVVVKQAQNSYFDRTLVTVLVELLAEDGLIDKTRLEKLWNERCKRESADAREQTNDEPRTSRHKARPQKKRSTKRSRS